MDDVKFGFVIDPNIVLVDQWNTFFFKTCNSQESKCNFLC